MAKIVVTLHGQILSELNLEPGQEYFAGRSAQCQILLENERGISRQHVRFYQENNIWHAELMSKFGGLVFEGENVYNITLQGEMRFSVPPYEFCYNEDIQVEQTQDDSADKSPELDVSEESLSGNLDATAVGVTTLVAYLKINNTQLRTSEILKLEGNMWTLGRHPSCEIIINDSAVSRKHFDLTKTSEGYFISDHGSSNSTKINGDKIPPNTPHRINSGDVIAIRHIEIIFEIHDIAYEKQLSAVPEFSKSVIYESDKINHDNNPFENSIINSPAQLSNSEAQPGEVLRIPPPNKFKSFKPNPIQIIIGILFVVLIFGLFYKNETGEKSAASNKPPE
ncbi:MAG: FHA domain-containing protein, partial [Bdellovibrionales bacterium]|nr:FHA domain-containing protein [Bdellovibrionales bacterium]